MRHTLKILIVEDEFIIARNLSDDLLEMGYTITAVATDAKEALLEFRKRIPDLVLMDINLNDKELDGIAVATKFNEITSVPIIYLTSLQDSNTRERAKRTKPAYYLLKPWQTTQLEIAIDFALYNFTNAIEAQVDHSLSVKENINQKLLLKDDFCFVKTTSNSYERMNIEDFIYAKGAGESVEIFTTHGKRFLSANLKSFARQFTHHDIIRVHRSYIINITKVKALQDGYLILETINIPIGPSYKSSLLQSLNLLKAD